MQEVLGYPAGVGPGAHPALGGTMRQGSGTDQRVLSRQRRQPAVGVVGGIRHHRLHQRREGESRRRPTSPARSRPCTRRRFTWSREIFQVEELDFVGRKAHVKAVDCDYYTTTTYTKVTILKRFAEERDPGRGTAKSTSCHASSASRRSKSTNQNVVLGRSRICPSSKSTTACNGSRCRCRSSTRCRMRPTTAVMAWLAVHSRCKQIAQMTADVPRARPRPLGANAWRDRRRRHAADLPLRRVSGGIGLERAALEHAVGAAVLDQRVDLGCDRETGCPMCVGPIGQTGPLAKTVALRMLQHLLAASLGDGSATARAVALQTESRSLLQAMATLHSTPRNRQAPPVCSSEIAGAEAPDRQTSRFGERRAGLSGERGR